MILGSQEKTRTHGLTWTYMDLHGLTWTYMDLQCKVSRSNPDGSWQDGLDLVEFLKTMCDQDMLGMQHVRINMQIK